jgi:hypothetical protein
MMIDNLDINLMIESQILSFQKIHVILNGLKLSYWRDKLFSFWQGVKRSMSVISLKKSSIDLLEIQERVLKELEDDIEKKNDQYGVREDI